MIKSLFSNSKSATKSSVPEKEPPRPTPAPATIEAAEYSEDEDAAALDALKNLSQMKEGAKESKTAPKNVVKIKKTKSKFGSGVGAKQLKTLTKTKAKGHRKNNADRLRWERYIYRIFRSVFPHEVDAKKNVFMTGKVMSVMTNIVDDMISTIMKQADQLRHSQRRTTMLHRDLKTAVGMIMPRELALHANSRAAVALGKFEGSDRQSLE